MPNGSIRVEVAKYGLANGDMTGSSRSKLCVGAGLSLLGTDSVIGGLTALSKAL